MKRARDEGVTDVTPEREGRDGKVYRLPVREQSTEEFEAEIEPQNKRSAFILRADQAQQVAVRSSYP